MAKPESQRSVETKRLWAVAGAAFVRQPNRARALDHDHVNRRAVLRRSSGPRTTGPPPKSRACEDRELGRSSSSDRSSLEGFCQVQPYFQLLFRF